LSWYGLDVFPRRDNNAHLIGRDISSRRPHRDGLNALHSKAPAGG
jgi:hypothetical protein